MFEFNSLSDLLVSGLPVFGAVLLGLLIALIIAALATPLYIGLLVNQQQPGKKSGFHLFTYIEHGQAKIVVRGERVVRMIMDSSSHRFKREGGVRSAAHWEIEESEDGENPLTGIHPFIMPWAKYVFRITGAVFTGIYPFQRVREYQLERTKISRKEDNVADTENSAGGTSSETESNLILKIKTDISDHYRTRVFLYPIHVVGAETKDKIPLEVIGVIKAHTTNPYLSGFGIDEWDQLLVNLSTDAINTTTRTLSVDDVLTAENADDAKRVSKAVTAITDDTRVGGIEIDGFDTNDIKPILSPENLSKLQAEALAKQVGKATVIDGKSRAEAQNAINKVMKKGGPEAVQTMQNEALVNAAAAAGKNGTVFLNSGSQQQNDPTLTAILAEIKRSNDERKAK